MPPLTPKDNTQFSSLFLVGLRSLLNFDSVVYDQVHEFIKTLEQLRISFSVRLLDDLAVP